MPDLDRRVDELSSSLAARSFLQATESLRAELLAEVEAAEAEEARQEHEAEQLRGFSVEAASSFFRGTLTADRDREAAEATAAAQRADALRRKLGALDDERRALRDAHPDPLAAARAVERTLAGLGVELPDWVEAERARRIQLGAAAATLRTFARSLRTAEHDADLIPADITGFDDRERMRARAEATERVQAVTDQLQGLAEQLGGVDAALRAAGLPHSGVELAGTEAGFVPREFDQAGVHLFGLACRGAAAAERALAGVRAELEASEEREFNHQEALVAAARSRTR